MNRTSQAMPPAFDPAFALSLVDLTSLNATDTQADIVRLAQQGVTALGPVAGLCIYPRFVPVAKAALQQANAQVRVVTVANFPEGGEDAGLAAEQVRLAVELGADEVDVVLPWRALLQGRTDTGRDLVRRCRDAVGRRLLKVIIESGCLQSDAAIRLASRLAIDGGAHFLKTSTGKAQVHATLPAARVMLETIRDSGSAVGFKAAGGIRSCADAQAYLALAEQVMGADWPRPSTFRFGASGLLQALLQAPGGLSAPAAAADY